MIKDIELMFNSLKGSNGLISYKDLVENISELVDSSEDRKLFNQIDLDKDGYISYNELKIFMESKFENLIQ